MIKPENLRCEYLVNPLGIDILKPRLSWILGSNERAQNQTAYHILVASSKELLNKNQGDLWDTGKVVSDQSIHNVYDGTVLKSQMFCYWKVRVWDKENDPSNWSEPAMWSMGLLESDDWKGKWIGAPSKRKLWIKKYLPRKYYPSPLLRKSFSLKGEIKRAVIYTTVLGEYELYLNGKRVGDHIFAPEWTDYNKRVQYQTYDVTDLLKEDENILGAILGDGWYMGNLGPGMPFFRKHSFWGVNRRLLLQLVIELSDGSLQEVVTDQDWKILLDGPIQKADHFIGEVYDVKKEQPGWEKPGYDDSHWLPVTVDDSVDVNLVAQMNEPIKIVKEINPIGITEPKPGVFIFNLGQNIAGWCRIRLGGSTCDPDATITLRHGEWLKANGKLYTKNLRRAKATDIYILAGTEEREFHPHFTYHGFQYVELKGLKSGVKPDLDMLIGSVIASDAPLAGAFESSDPTLNKLWSNILWTQRDNMISVPTDCPQRNERMGWMGDVTAFNQTSIFNMNMAAFYTKWIKDMRDAQPKNGRYPDIVPYPMTKWEPIRLKGAPAWTDCGVILPWNVYLNYNDKRLIKQHYQSAKKLVDFIHSRNPDLIRVKAVGFKIANFGDWLNGNTIRVEGYPRKGASIPKDAFGTAFFARVTEILSKMAGVIGLTEESTHYADLAQRIKDRFTEEFVSEDGTIKGDAQACYALALHFDLLPEEIRPKAVINLLKAIKKYDGRISTGFLSTLPLMLELTRAGQNETAYSLLLSRRFPSWFFIIDQGATTIWERWDSYYPERGFQSTFMTSFNHFAFGSVGEWIYKAILGINLDENQPGYKHIIIKPQPGGTLTWAKGHYNSIHGKIEVNWKLEDKNFNLEVTIPVNTTATVHIPATNQDEITESGKVIEESDEIQFIDFKNNIARYKIASGKYQFKSDMPS